MLITLSHGHCQSAACCIAVGTSEEMATLPVHEKHSAEEVWWSLQGHLPGDLWKVSLWSVQNTLVIVSHVIN